MSDPENTSLLKVDVPLGVKCNNKLRQMQSILSKAQMRKRHLSLPFCFSNDTEYVFC